MAYLILARHGESEFNAKSLWTGIWDVPLTEKGEHEALLMAGAIQDMAPQVAYTSALSRASHTLAIILHANHWSVPVHASAALNERDYGQLTGMNKWTVEKEYGQAQFNAWRRGWDEPVPGGETLKDVYTRAVGYFIKHILPNLQANRNIILTAHGNTLRALIKYLDQLDDQAVQSLEMPFGTIAVYEIDPAGQVRSKQTRRINTVAPPA